MALKRSAFELLLRELGMGPKVIEILVDPVNVERAKSALLYGHYEPVVKFAQSK